MSRILFSSLKYSYLRLNYASLAVQNRAILKSSLPCASCLISKCNYSSPAAAARAAENVDERINKMDRTVKRLGRTTLRDVQGALRDLQRAGTVSATQSLMIIRSCGSLLVEVKPEERTELVQRIWETLKKMGVELDISHYNALLRVYLENEHSFNPSDILAEIEKSGLEPNRVTCQRLISRYCQMGDIPGATRVLQFMRDKGMPINESVFNALISGHAEVNDMESAEGILTLMRESGLEPSSETYTLLICGFIKNGNLEKVEEILKKCQSADVMFSDKDYFDIVYTYAMHGYHKEIDAILSKIKKLSSYNHDAMNFSFKLLTANQPETAYKVLKSMLRTTRPDGSHLPIGNFFISYLIRDETPMGKVMEYCADLVNENMNPRAFAIALENALRLGKESMAISLLKEAKEKDLLPIRQHYFWPLLVNRGKTGDLSGMYEILEIMRRDFDIMPSQETIRDYVVPYALKHESDLSKILLDLKSYGIGTSIAAGCIVNRLLDEGRIKHAATVAGEYVCAYALKSIRASLIAALYKTNDASAFVAILQDVSAHVYWWNNRETEGEAETLKLDHREYAGEIVEHVVEKLLEKNRHDVAQKVLEKTVESGIGISEGRVKSIQALVKDVFSSEIVTSLEKLSSSEFAVPSVKTKTSKMTVSSLDDKALERLYEMAKAKGEEPHVTIKRSLFTIYAKNGDLDKMNRMKAELETDGHNFNVASHVHMMEAHLKNDKMEEALQIYQTLCDNDPTFHLNPHKTLNLVKYLVEHEQYDKAREVLKRRVEVQSADDVTEENEGNRKRLVFRILNKLSDEGDVEKTKEFLELIIAAKLVEPENYVLGPVIRAYIKRGDYDGAMKEFEHCVDTYKATPLKNELAGYFIEKEDAASLQKLVDLSTKVHGEMNSLIDLMLVFLEGGRLKQARRVLETPGLYVRPERFEIMCSSLLDKGNVESLLNLLKVTKDLVFIDRALVYEKLLSFYEKGNDTQNSLSLWLELQEEDLQPSDTFLIELADLLTRNDMNVPFIVPERSRSVLSERRASSRPRSRTRSDKLRKLIESGDLESAMETANSLKFVGKYESTGIVEKLLQQNRYTEAKQFFLDQFKRTNSMIHRNVFKFLLTQAMENGDLTLFEALDNAINPGFRTKNAFDNLWARTYAKVGRVDEYLTSWEEGLKQIKNKEELRTFLLKYPRGGILDITLEHPECIPRVEKFAQKCLEIDDKCLMASVLFNLYFVQKDHEKTSQIWNTYLKNANQVLFQGILTKMRKDVEPEFGAKLLSFLKSNPNIEKKAFAMLYNCLIDVHVRRNEIQEGKKYLEDALTRIPIELLHIKTLESLKSACFDKKIDFPYKIPEYQKRNLARNKRAAGSDSDSDSDSD